MDETTYEIDAAEVADEIGGADAYDDGPEVVHLQAEGCEGDGPMDVPWSATVTAPDALYETEGKWHAGLYVPSEARGMHDLLDSTDGDTQEEVVAWLSDAVDEWMADWDGN